MKILLADSNEVRREALTAQLIKLGAAFSITPLAGEASLMAEVERLRPDVVLVDMARPDRDMLDSLPALNGAPPVVMFLDNDDPGFMQQAISAGVSSYHGQDVAPDAAKLVMQLAVAFFQRNQEVAAKLQEVEGQAAQRRTIDAAKRVLMKEERMGEPAAHRFLQRRAMDQQKRLADVAADYLAAQTCKGQKP
ncbi:response regulator receiver and ANTAR domain protein [Acidocella aminolytica 101 = DSM 11237]|jgi:response regulator NasT|uniref:Two component transcriptional regulator n=2 Tax=Acidocella TaxID=50709 RepID=A0A0D6PE87_9PROT|nr:two component transcriptional regulator [Acidocella aminolytica 101 = DSM 11237]GBQ43562.1 putative response regulator [Acidocella aminolytica 101 = DSM 11237]SHE68179.1 response regulator receiver and ANTAR domain protein [Acidocella aminolytica 101 = DSM 11237]